MTEAGSMDEDGERLAAWAERELGGQVTWIERLPRWRPAWNLDVDLGDRVVPLHARGEREQAMAMPFWIADERRVHDLLEAHGIPVPHVFGYCDDPYVMVMDRLSGNVDLTFASTEAERSAIRLEYLELLPRIHGIDLEEVRAAGFRVPGNAEEVALNLFSAFEAAHDERMEQPDPVSEFLRVWLHRNHPRHRDQPRFITFDAFQFMFDEGRITGLLDFELATVGDPQAELAALRIRDTIKNVGDLPAIAAIWEEVTGDTVDPEVITYHSVAYNAQTVLGTVPAIARPTPEGDLMSYLGWYVNSARWALEDIADLTGVALSPAPPPSPTPTRYGDLDDLLVACLARGAASIGGDDYERGKLFRLARHLERVRDLGPAIDAASLDDAEVLLGRRPAIDALDEALVAFIRESGPEDDEALLRLLYRRLEWHQATLGPEGSNMVRHPRLPGFFEPRDGAPAPADDQRWTPGLIPGTR